MPRITLELLRKRSEHNEGEISTLEEISLHQENIEKIELIDRTCKDLRILLLQYNLISKIENLGRLKRLEYLNLALNNIEEIENLEGLESLKKLDLTVNFIGDLRCIKKLRHNENLEELILTGNPCAYYEGYREYTVATLTQIKELDMLEITRSERIKALQDYACVEGDIIRAHKEYRRTREAQISRHREETALNQENEDEEAENERFWKQTSQHTPEDRIAIAKRCMDIEEKRNRKNQKDETPKYVPKLFDRNGRPYNVNQAKVKFRLNDEDNPDLIILEIELYKFLDTSYVDVDVQPEYVRVSVKGKILQLTLPCQVLVDKSTAKRNVTSGSLVITMPRLNGTKIIGRKAQNDKTSKVKSPVVRRSWMTTREYLEIGPPKDDYDFSKIVSRSRNKESRSSLVKKSTESEIKFDNPDVPPLE